MTAYFPAVRLRRATFVGALCAGLAVVATACGADPDEGTNGVGKLSAEQIEGKAKTAATEASSVHLSGTLVTGGKSYTLDMRLGADGGSGEVKSQDDTTFQLLRVGEQLYLKAGAKFWGQSEAAGKLGDKFVKVPEGDPSYKQFRGFTDMHVLLDGLLGLDGKLAKGDYTKVGHTRAVQVTADKGAGGKLAVSLEGTPYPLLMERAGGAGRVVLADWGKPVDLAPPGQDQTVDYGSQLPTTKGQGSGSATPAPKGSGQGTAPKS
ncbi:lipoprotein [Streptomyces avidinii]